MEKLNIPDLIGVSGKIYSGKDEVGLIVQYLTDEYAIKDNLSYTEWLAEKVDLLSREEELNYTASEFKIKKFAGKLKEALALLLGCTTKKLENREYKNSILGKEWWYYNFLGTKMVPYTDVTNREGVGEKYLIKYTPRLLLQVLGTNAGRNIVHPDIWVNASFSDYIPERTGGWSPSYSNPDNSGCDPSAEYLYPQWVFTDMRFPNEVKAIESRNGLCIRIVRDYVTQCNEPGEIFDQLVKLYFYSEVTSGEFIHFVTFDSRTEKEIIQKGIENFLEWDESSEDFTYVEAHESETALDGWKFEHVIVNDGDLNDLADKVKNIFKNL